jgi:hypothetical protein
MNFYLIIYHNDNSIVRTLVDILGSNLYIHPCASIDKSSDFIKKNFDNKVKITNKRFYGNWGGFGIVEATIEGIRQILNENPSCTHITLLSGADFPIKPVKSYEQFLDDNKEKSFIRYWDFFPFESIQNDNPWKESIKVQELRFKRYYFDVFNTRYSVPPIENMGYFEFESPLQKIKHFIKTKGKGFTSNHKKEIFQFYKSFFLPYPRVCPIPKVYGASQWWTINRKHCEYIVEYHDKNKTVKEFFKYSMLPDETYIQSILLNSIYFNEVENDNLRLINFPNGSSHPEIFNEYSYHKIKVSNAFFARKFDENKSRTLIQMISEKLLLLC